MALKKKEAKKPIAEVTVDDLEMLAGEYDRLSEQIKKLDARKKELATQIKESAKKIGTVNDKGSYYVATDSYVCGSVRRVSLKPDIEKGYDFLMNYECEDGSNLRKCLQQVTTYVIDEEELGNAVQEGRVDIETIRENVYTQTESFSVSVERKEESNITEMPEVIQTTVKKAARRK